MGKLGGLALAATLAVGVTAIAADVRAAAPNPVSGKSRVVLHGAPAVDSVRVRSVETLRHGEGAWSDDLPTPRLLGDGALQLDCPMATACAIHLQARDGAKYHLEVFAMEPTVEVELTPGPAGTLRVTYRDAGSRSAGMAAVAASARDLAAACEAGHEVTALFKQHDLRRRTHAADPLVADVAALALAEGQCRPMSDDGDAQIHEAVLSLAPDNPALRWWPGGLVAAASAVDPDRGWAKIDAVVSAQRKPDHAGNLLFVAYVAANEDDDGDGRDQALQRLRVPTLSATPARRAAETHERFRRSTR